MNANEVLLLEKSAFYNEEKKGDEKFAEELVKPADLYVSTLSQQLTVPMLLWLPLLNWPGCYGGLLMEEEVNALTNGLNDPKRPLMAVVGGSKVSTKLDLLNNLVKKS